MQSLTVCFLLPLIFTVHAEVVTNFKNACKTFFYKNLEPQVRRPEDYTHICQRFENKYHFATLYDTANRIPVYSAYIYERNNGKSHREDQWYIEPQLVDQNWEKDMMREGDLELKHPNVKMGNDQAIDSDYTGLERNKGFNRGHLNPNQHHSDPGRKATFTLTNIVPQDKGLNGGSWNKYEEDLKKTLQDCKTAYVLVGAIPSKNHWIVKDNQNRVNIPAYMWHAYCCVNNNGKLYKSGAAAVRNEDTTVVKCSLDSLKRFFQKVKSRIHQPFSKNCKARISIGAGDCESVVR